MLPTEHYTERRDRTFDLIIRRAEKQDRASEKQRQSGKAFKLWWV